MLEAKSSRRAARAAHSQPALSRRDLLARAGGGFGSLALTFLLAQEAVAVGHDGSGPASRPQPSRSNTQAPDRGRGRGPGRPVPDFRPRAKSVIFLFMFGGPSQVDTFDPKPELDRHHGQPVGSVLAGVQEIKTFFGDNLAGLMRSPFHFRKYGDSGIEVSELFPNVATCVDDLCVIRSLYGDSNNHAPATYQMNTGGILPGRPSLGAWLAYGLGSENRNLPGFVVMVDPVGAPIGGAPNWSSGFMPAAYQGTVLRANGSPILDLSPADASSAARQRATLDLLGQMNAGHLRMRPGDGELEARIAAYELAFRMQTAAPEAVDLPSESAETKALYGLGDGRTDAFGRQCLLARRLVERGVRFIQIYSGGVDSGRSWDAHSD